MKKDKEYILDLMERNSYFSTIVHLKHFLSIFYILIVIITIILAMALTYCYLYEWMLDKNIKYFIAIKANIYYYIVTTIVLAFLNLVTRWEINRLIKEDKL